MNTNQKKRIVSMLLCLLLVCLSVLLPACTIEDEANDSSHSTVSGEEAHELFDNLPDVNYGGKEVVFLVEGDYMGTYASIEVCPEDTKYQRLNEALALRNTKVEERFGVKIVEERTSGAGDMLSKLRNNEILETNSYDIVMPFMGDAATMSATHAFHDLNELENIHLDASYYDQGSVKDLSILGKNFFVTGDLSLLSIACTHAIVFNKDVLRDNNLDDPYAMVKNHTWTLDAMQEMARSFTADIDGEPGYGYKDHYGFLVNTNFVASMFIGAGQRFTVKDSADCPKIAIDSTASQTVFGRIFDIVNDVKTSGKLDGSIGTFYTTASKDGKNVWVAATEAVANKTVLFRAMSLIDIFDLANYTCNFGILPTPMLDTTQDRYYSRVSTIFATCIAIPANAQDAEMSAVIADAMMQASTDTTKQAYFQTILRDRQIQDNESEDMLDIIFDSRVYDLAFIYNWGGASEYDINSISGFMNNIAFSGVNTFTSDWGKIEGKVESAIQNTLDSFDFI